MSWRPNTQGYNRPRPRPYQVDNNQGQQSTRWQWNRRYGSTYRDGRRGGGGPARPHDNDVGGGPARPHDNDVSLSSLQNSIKELRDTQKLQYENIIKLLENINKNKSTHVDIKEPTLSVKSPKSPLYDCDFMDDIDDNVYNHV